MTDNHYLRLLSRQYPNAAAAAAEIINLRAIMVLPKGTEFFFSDLHGEHDAFLFQLRSASGVVRKKIDELFEQSIGEGERAALAKLIYYPESEIPAARQREKDFSEWCRVTVYRLTEICREAASKYTRSKVRKKLPEKFAYTIDELLHANGGPNKVSYESEIIRSITETGMGADFILELCILIRELLIDRLHIIGDIFDRGPHADKIMDILIGCRDVDIQWGNHDISWMGAACGNPACIANVVRLGISYNNFDLLEDGYGINLRPLSVFAEKVYRDDPCTCFQPHLLDKNQYDPVDMPLAAKMHKAIAVIQFKTEAQLIRKHPEYRMNDRILLDKIDFKRGTVLLGEKEYPLKDTCFPTVDPADPLRLTKGEEELLKTISYSFQHSERLNHHIRFLYSHGTMYLRCNSNLLYHGCIPMTESGDFEEVEIGGRRFSGRDYLEYLDTAVRTAYFAPEGSPQRENACDLMWYLWCGSRSPLYGKSKLALFERCFISDPAAHTEVMNPYYSYIESRETCKKILREFDLNADNSHIINGHVPVRLKEGESPVKGSGLLFMIDGGISKAYQKQTGIGGYTFIDNSRYLALAEHKPLRPGSIFGEDSPKVMVVKAIPKRVTVGDTDVGKDLRARISELEDLMSAYRNGTLQEQ